MFDATKGQQAVTSQIETLSDEFASRFDELPPRQQLTLLQQFNQLLDAPDQVSAFQAGTYAQNAAGQPAAALGTGRPPGSTPTDAHTGLRAILSDPGVDPGIQRALVRLLTPADPEYLPVDRQGTPVDMIAASRERDAARAERNTAKAERDAAQQELANERSVTHNGSLAKQLATAIAERDTARAAAGGYDQNAARAAAQAVLAAINAQRGKLGGTVEGKDVVIAKLGELAQTIGLRAAPPATP